MSSLLLRWSKPLCLGWVSSHLQQMTKGKTYLIIHSLNYRYGAESLDSYLLPVSSTLLHYFVISFFLLGRRWVNPWRSPLLVIWDLRHHLPSWECRSLFRNRLDCGSWKWNCFGSTAEQWKDIFMNPSRQLKKRDKRGLSDGAISSNKQEGEALI